MPQGRALCLSSGTSAYSSALTKCTYVQLCKAFLQRLSLQVVRFFGDATVSCTQASGDHAPSSTHIAYEPGLKVQDRDPLLEPSQAELLDHPQHPKDLKDATSGSFLLSVEHDGADTSAAQTPLER